MPIMSSGSMPIMGIGRHRAAASGAHPSCPPKTTMSCLTITAQCSCLACHHTHGVIGAWYAQRACLFRDGMFSA